MTMRTFFLAISIILLVESQTLKLAVASEDHFAPGYSVEEIIAKANEGDAEAQADLGSYYFRGIGLPQDIGAATKWYLKAANQNNEIAQQMLGFLGDRAGQYEEATQWFRKSAEQGSAVAQREMGLRYLRGSVGLPQDYAQAAKWFRSAAEKGETTAQFHLGSMYMHGEGVEKDFATARRWYQHAAEQGHLSAQFYLGVSYDRGLAIPQDDVMAAKWFRRAADQGNGSAQYMLGLAYRTGHGISRDYVQSHKWLNLAAAAEFEDSESHLNTSSLREGLYQLPGSLEWLPAHRTALQSI